MGPLQGEISVAALSEDSRGSARRTLRLGISVSSSQSWTKTLIHDLSETGLMIETTAELEVGETILFDLPVAGMIEARTVWKRKTYYGCEFLTPVSKAAVSAALLQAPFDPSDPAMQPQIEELEVGIKPSDTELEAWKSEFEKTKGASGYQLAGFRQTPDGLVLAIVLKRN